MADERSVHERMHSDDSGVQGPVDGDNPRWLNQADVVDGIVREFAAAFLRRYGQIPTDGLMAWLSNECARMNSLFIGEGLLTMPYRRGPWNTPDQLGFHLSLALNLDGEIRLAVRDAFMVFAAGLGDLVRAHQDPASLDALKAALDGATAKFAQQLLGLDDAER